MKAFWIRTVNVLAVVLLLMGYQQVLKLRTREDEIAKLTAELESSQWKTDQLLTQYEAEQTAGNEAEGRYQDGVYKGTADGFGGTISVSVTVEHGEIADISILSADGEDGTYLEMASGIIDEIIDAQSAEVDTVSGATFSSTGIKNAVKEALEAAA